MSLSEDLMEGLVKIDGTPSLFEWLLCRLVLSEQLAHKRGICGDFEEGFGAQIMRLLF